MMMMTWTEAVHLYQDPRARRQSRQHFSILCCYLVLVLVIIRIKDNDDEDDDDDDEDYDDDDEDEDNDDEDYRCQHL